MEFDKKFKEFLKSQGLTAREAAKKIGVSEQVMSKYANAQKPNIVFVDKLVSTFPFADLNYLLKDENSFQGVTEPGSNYKNANLELVEEIESRLLELKRNLSLK